MELGGFTVSIPQGREREDGYVEMQHDTVYVIRLGNNGGLNADADVHIDGKRVGCFRVPAGRRYIEIDHPWNDDGLFTFYRLDSGEARASEISTNTETGLVTVIFIPEKKRIGPPEKLSAQPLRLGMARPHSDETILDTHAAGGTGLSGKSNATYGTAEPLCLDHSAQVTIHLRLICLKPVPVKPRPLVSSPIPPPLT